MKPIKIIPVSRWLYRVEVQMPGGYWRCVHDCPGIPWSDAKKYLPSTTEEPNDSTPHFIRGLGHSRDVVISHRDMYGETVKQPLCDWCFQNSRDYMAVSDKGREFVCRVCAADVDGPFVE